MSAEVERFWCRPGGGYRLDADGYLADPGDLFGRAGDARDTGSLVEHRGLVLLGEPGSGKSTAIHRLARFTAVTRASQAQVVTANLGLYGDESRVVTEVLRGSSVRAWRAGDGELFLFLDSLDECRLEVPKIASILAAELSVWPVERLWLRVACRTADWPVALANAIDAHLGDVMTVELLPLRRRDVTEIAADAGVDAASFLSAVNAASVVAFAIRPLTLTMLLATFADSGVLPTRTAELYAQGCALLADEQNLDRRAAGHVGSLTADQRLAVASRLAALSLFAGTGAISTAAAGGPTDDDALTVDVCAGGTEPSYSGPAQVDRSAVVETLRTGLFTSRGLDRLGWAHLAYAEYLAGRYLAAHLNLNQTRELLTSSVTGRTRVFPVVRQVAAWLVATDPSQYGSLVDDDPQAFIDAGVPLGDPATTERLVDALLTLAERGEHAPSWNTRYAHLAHPRLTGQLRAWLGDPNRAVDGRVLAADIAGAVRSDELVTDLLAVFVDPAEDMQLRLRAGHALEALPPGTDTVPVRVLAAGAAEDSYDELKGLALRLLWPGTLTLQELLAVLCPPKQRNVAGAYRRFVVVDLPQALQPAHLPTLLQWLLALDSSRRNDRIAEHLQQTIARLALEHIDQAGVVGPLAEVTAQLGKEHLPLLPSTVRFGHDDPPVSEPTRRRLLAAVIDHLPDDPGQAWSVLDVTLDGSRQQPLLAPADLPWLLNRYDDPEAPPRHQLIERLLALLFHPDHPGHHQLVLELPEGHPLRSNAFAHWLEPVELGSKQAAELRQRFKPPRAGPRRNPDAPTDIELEERIDAYLDAFDDGYDDGYWQAQYVLAIDDNAWDCNEFQADITALPRWRTLPEATQRRIIATAPRYLELARCQPERWLGTPTMHRPAYAAYRALVLLLRSEPAGLDALPPDRWANWAPIVLAYPTSGNDKTAKHTLVQKTVQHAPAEFLDAVRTLLDTAVTTGTTLGVDDELAVAWSDELAALLAAAARRPNLNAELWHQVVILLAPRDPAGLTLAVEALDPTARTNEPARAVLALGVLFDYNMPQRWPIVADLLNDDPTFAEAALLNFAHYHGRGVQAPPLNVNHLADLYIWLVQHFQPHDDPEPNGWVSPRQAIGRWRDTIFAAISREGTPESLAAFAHIRHQLPHIKWAYPQAEVETAALTRAWAALAPAELRQLTERHHTRLVRDAAHLHNIVSNALDDIAADLQSNTPSARWLWDERVMQPKLEPAISDYVKNKLDNLLRGHNMIVNREVQVRHVKPTGIGDSVDLLVHATRTTDRNDHATVVVEVKGCWNQTLTTDITTQLCNRYLPDCNTTHGIYLVAWFDTTAWRTDEVKDWRRTRTANLDWPATLNQLRQTADELTVRGAHITVQVLNASWHRPPSPDKPAS